MATLEALYPWESAELFGDELEVRDLAADADYDAWLAEALADVNLDLDAEPEAEYVPFQDVNPFEFEENFDDQIGYYESRCPYLY